MTVWIVLWDGGMRDVCISRENAIIAAKHFLETELEDTYVDVDESHSVTCIHGHYHTIIIYERETDTWVQEVTRMSKKKTKPKTWAEIFMGIRKPLPPPTRLIPDKRNKKPKHKKKEDDE